MQRKYLLLSLIMFFCQITIAQEKQPKTDFGKMFLPVWLEARKHCLEVAEAMPEDLYRWKPTEVSKTFAGQMVHIAYTIELLTQRYVQGMEVVANGPDANKMSKAEIIKMLEESFDYTIGVIHEISDNQLNEKTKMYHSGNIVSRAFAFFYVIDHTTNHRAKANLYIRMNSIQPPEYTW